jgi:hypothetical protein
MKTMIQHRTLGLVSIVALFLSGACASTSAIQSGAANRVTVPVKQLSEKQLEQRHESLSISAAKLQVRARYDVQRGFHRVALEKFRTVERILVNDIEILSELQARQPTLKDRVRVEGAISEVRTTLKNVRKTVRLLAFHSRI